MFFFFRLFSSAIFMQSQSKSMFFLGGKFYHFPRKNWENVVFSSVNSINFTNFSEIIVKFFVTKTWKRKGERAKGNKTGAGFLLTKSQPKKKKKKKKKNEIKK
jgi:hypothetical protein